MNDHRAEGRPQDRPEDIEAVARPSLSKLRILLATDLMRSARRYFLAGGFCALLDWGLFALFLYVLTVHYIAAGALSFVIATGVNYVVSAYFVFGASRRGARQAIVLVYAVSAVGIAINLAVLTVSIDLLGLHPMLAKMIASGIAVVWNFLTRYFYIFR